MTCAQGLLRLLWGGPKLECYGTGQDRLGILALLRVERELLYKTDFSSAIDEFAAIKSRKVKIKFIRH